MALQQTLRDITSSNIQKNEAAPLLSEVAPLLSEVALLPSGGFYVFFVVESFAVRAHHFLNLRFKYFVFLLVILLALFRVLEGLSHSPFGLPYEVAPLPRKDLLGTGATRRQRRYSKPCVILRLPISKKMCFRPLWRILCVFCCI